MKKTNILKTLVAGLMAGTGIATSSCTDNFTAPATPTGNTITQVVTTTDSLKGFGAALSKVGLSADFSNVNSGQFTVFAPTNYAFVKYLRASGIPVGYVTTASAGDSVALRVSKLKTTGSLTIAQLQTRLNYHIISSNLPSSSIPATGFGSVTLGGTARLSISKGSNVPGITVPFIMNANLGSNPHVSSDNGANVLDSGTPAANGVVYTIDNVMSPVSTANIWNSSSFLNFNIVYGASTVVSIGGTTVNLIHKNSSIYDISTAPIPASPTASDSAKYNLFTMALVHAGLAKNILPNGVSILPDYTVFAPTDGAFFKYLGTDLSGGLTNAAYASARTSINAMDTLVLANLVKYHILSNRTLTSDLSNAESVSTWLTGKSFTANVSGSIYTLHDLNGTSQDAVISAPNKLTNAGVLHGIRRVLQPE